MSEGTNEGDHAAAERDHLEALFFSPAAGGSRGAYTPGAFDLHLAGGDDLAVAASCLADEQWRADWLPVLQELAPIVWLIDVPIGSLATEFGADRIVHGLYLDLDPASSGAQRAVAFKVIGHAGIWLALADEVGVNLITQQVAELPGIDLRLTGADWTALTPTLRLVLLDLQRTESHTELRALDASKVS